MVQHYSHLYVKKFQFLLSVSLLRTSTRKTCEKIGACKILDENTCDCIRIEPSIPKLWAFYGIENVW